MSRKRSFSNGSKQPIHKLTLFNKALTPTWNYFPPLWNGKGLKRNGWMEILLNWSQKLLKLKYGLKLHLILFSWDPEYTIYRLRSFYPFKPPNYMSYTTCLPSRDMFRYVITIRKRFWFAWNSICIDAIYWMRLSMIARIIKVSVICMPKAEADITKHDLYIIIHAIMRETESNNYFIRHKMCNLYHWTK